MAERRICPVCGNYEFEEAGCYDICEYCGWEDDPLQYDNPDYEGGANHESLNQARAIFKKNDTYLDWMKEQREARAKGSGPHLCPVCKKHTFPEWHSCDTCPVCGWEDDAVQTLNPDRAGYDNHMSLNQAREAYAKGEEVI